MRISDWSSDVCSSDLEYLQVASAGIVPDLFALSVQIRHFRVVTPKRRRGARGARPSFKDAVARLADALAATVKAQGKLAQARNRLEADRKSTRLNSSH